MFKLIWSTIKFVFFIIVLGLIFHQITSRFFLSSLLRYQLGVPVEVGKAQIDFVNAEIRFEDVEIWNPSGFPPGVMIYLREMVFDSEISRLFNPQPSFNKIEFDVDNVRVDKPMDESINLLSTNIYKKGDRISSGSFFNTDEFVLSVGRASFHDEGRAGSGDSSAEIGLRRMTYYKVKSLRDMFDIMNWEILKKMHLEPLGSGYLDQISEDLEGKKPAQSFNAPKSAAWR